MLNPIARRAAVIATVLGLGVCLPGAPAEADLLCVTATGTVYDLYGVPIPGATITLPTPDCGVSGTTTDSLGRYQIPVHSTGTEQANASKPGYDSETVFVRFYPAGGTGNDFSLRYAFTQSGVTPGWVQPGGTVAVTARSLATPPPSSDGYVCEWGWSPLREEDLHHPAPVPGIGGVGVLSGAKAIATGAAFSVALLGDGRAATWGWNNGGTLGDGATTDWYARPPAHVVDVDGTSHLGDVTEIAAGSSHALARRADGTVVAWGGNWSRQLGRAEPEMAHTPSAVPGIGGSGTLTGVKSIAAGGEQSVALLDDGRVVRWGLQHDGTAFRMAPPEYVQDVAGQVLNDVVAVDAGDYHAVALRADNTVVSWGSNTAGQLGRPGLSGSMNAVSVVGFNGSGVLSDVTQVSAGAYHSVVRLADATAGAWGSAQYGQLGDGTMSPAPGAVPRRVVSESGSGTASRVTRVYATGSHSFAQTANGLTLAWGENGSGQLGNDSTASSATPLRPHGGDGSGLLAGVRSIAGDNWNSVGIRSGPCDEGEAPTQVWIQTGSGATAVMQPMQQGSTDAQGYTTWTGSVTASGPDGIRSIRLCGIDRVYEISCDAALLEVGPIVSVIPTRTLNFGVDSTAPVLSTSSPARFGNVLALTTISASWADVGVGVATSSLTMSVDGTAKSVTRSGATVSASATGLAPGIHHVQVSAADTLGNATTASFIFTLVDITASPGTASLKEKIIDVVPPGTVLPPETVTFTSPTVAIGETTESLNAATFVGHGTVRRTVAFGAVDVEFTNGALSQTVSTPVASTTESHAVATIAPSGQPLTAFIPQHDVTVPSITVRVPELFRTAGSKARLIAKGVPLGGVVKSTGGFLAQALPAQAPVAGTIGVCMTGDEFGSISSCEADLQGGMTVSGMNAYAPIDPITDGSEMAATQQDCAGCVSPAPLAERSWAAFGVQCPTVVLPPPVGNVNLCTGTAIDAASSWSAYLNAWVYKEKELESSPTRFPIWQQDHAVAGSMPCPNGKGGTVSTRTYRVAANTVAKDQATGAILGATSDDPDNRRADPEYVYLGTLTGNSHESDLTPNPDIQFQLSNETGPHLPILQVGEYTGLIGGSMGPTGQIDINGSATSNIWEYDGEYVSSGAGVGDSVRLITGTEFRTPTVAGAFNLGATLAFQFVIDRSSCS